MADEKLFSDCEDEIDDYFYGKCLGIYTAGRKLEPYQIPLDVERDVKFVMEICGDDLMERALAELDHIGECSNHPLHKTFHLFNQKFALLNLEELTSALICDHKDLDKCVSSTVPCTGCRNGVDGLFKHLRHQHSFSLHPIVVLPESGKVTLVKDFVISPSRLFALFHLVKPKYEDIVDTIPKVKKSKRCTLHCLDSHKINPPYDWPTVWTNLSQECRENITQIPLEPFKLFLEEYLKKHKFCSECRLKMEFANSLLIKEHHVATPGQPNSSSSDASSCSNSSPPALQGRTSRRSPHTQHHHHDIEAAAEALDWVDKEFKPEVYRGLRVCAEPNAEVHIHVSNEDEFFMAFIRTAESELWMNRRERHAKTLESAQNELVLCLAMFLYEKLHRLGHRMRSEQQAWLLLISRSIEVIKCGFEAAVDSKQGYSQLELFCRQYQEEQRQREVRREQKREKKKRKRLIKRAIDETCNGESGDPSPTSTASPTVSSSPHGDSERKAGDSALVASHTLNQASGTVDASPMKIKPISCHCSCPESATASNMMRDPDRDRCSHCGHLREKQQPLKPGSKKKQYSGEGCKKQQPACRDSVAGCTGDSHQVPTQACTCNSSERNSQWGSLGNNGRGGGLQSQCNCSLLQEAAAVLNDDATEEDIVEDELARLKAQLPELKKEREQYREALRQKWMTVAASSNNKTLA